MQNCANCGHQNRPGVVYCENCGASLLGDKPLSTKSISGASEEEKAQMGIDSSILTDVKVQGVSAFSMDDTLRLDIDGSPEPITFRPKSETIFGRRDPATGAMPDVDLTPFAGYRMGVSRRHAAIRQGEEQSLNIWDLGSSNGTYLNGQKLNAHRPYRLHDGDELRLGQMVVRIRFQVGSEGLAKIGEVADKVSEVEAEPKATGKLDASEKPPITSDLKDEPLNTEQPAPGTEKPVQPEEVAPAINPASSVDVQTIKRPEAAAPQSPATPKQEPPITGELKPEQLPDQKSPSISKPQPGNTKQAESASPSQPASESKASEQPTKPDESGPDQKS